MCLHLIKPYIFRVKSTANTAVILAKVLGELAPH